MKDKKAKREKKKKQRKLFKEKYAKRFIKVKPGDVPYDIYLSLKEVVKEINSESTNKGLFDDFDAYFNRGETARVNFRYAYIFKKCDRLVTDQHAFEKYFPRKILRVSVDFDDMCFKFEMITLREIDLSTNCFGLIKKVFVEHDGTDHELVFTAHALKRISQRHSGETYDLSNIVINLNCGMIVHDPDFYEFEVITATNGQTLVKPKLDCGGYFSVIFEDGYAVAKTYLVDDWVEHRKNGDYVVLSSRVNDGR